MDYHHGYFMAAGLAVFLTGFALQFVFYPEILRPYSFQIFTVVGALLLGWGTGRCDECDYSEE